MKKTLKTSIFMVRKNNREKVMSVGTAKENSASEVCGYRRDAS